jgi:hypothetical protein
MSQVRPKRITSAGIGRTTRSELTDVHAISTAVLAELDCGPYHPNLSRLQALIGDLLREVAVGGDLCSVHVPKNHQRNFINQVLTEFSESHLLVLDCVHCVSRIFKLV